MAARKGFMEYLYGIYQSSLGIPALTAAIDALTDSLTPIVSSLSDTADRLQDIADQLGAAPVLTHTNVIVATADAATSADSTLGKDFYAVTAIGLVGAETVTIQVKDAVTGAYATLATLTSLDQSASIQYMPVIVRFVKSVTAAPVGVVLSHR